MHNDECVMCPDCGKSFGIGNLKTHIQSVHKKLKKICKVCNKGYANISEHNRKEHGIGKPIDQVTPTGPNMKLRKEYRQSANPDQVVYYMSEGNDVVKEITPNDDDEGGLDMKNEELDKVKVEDWMILDVDTRPATKTIIVGGKNFAFSPA